MVRIIRLIMVINAHIISLAFIIVVFIGTCRAVWVPRQDWLHHIWCTIAESVFCHYTVCYTYVCACLSTHMLYRESSRPVLNGEYAWFAGQCLGMLRLAGAYVGIRTKNFDLVRGRYSPVVNTFRNSCVNSSLTTSECIWPLCVLRVLGTLFGLCQTHCLHRHFCSINGHC